MKRKVTILAALVCSMFISCKGQEKETNAKKHAQMKKAGWLIGSWGFTTPEGTLNETWKKANDSVYNGQTNFIIGKDTVFTERIRLEETNGKLAYITAVSDQNDGKAIRFELTSITDKQMVFENPAHDFPQKITYNKISNDSLVAEISGMRNGKPASEVFPMGRRNQ